MNLVLIEALTFGLGRLAAAAEDFGVTLHLLTRDKNVYFYELAQTDSKYLVIAELDSFDQKAIIDYCQSLEEFGGIINLTDTWTLIAQEAAAKLGRPLPNAAAAALCRDKFRLRTILAAKGLTKGRAYSFSLVDYSENLAAAADFAYPLIVKDPNGTGSKNVWFADTVEDLTALLGKIKEQTKLPEVLAETYFKGTLFSAETVSFGGKTKCMAVTGRILSDMPYFMEMAAALPMATDNAQLRGVEAWVSAILAALSYTDGFAHTEFITTPHGFEVVEVNPRLAGGQIGEALCQAYGCNIYRAFIEMALGQEPQLLKTALTQQTAIGQVLLYAQQKGRFGGIDAQHINAQKTALYPCAVAGKKIENLHDQSACVAILSSRGENSELALLNALAEANKLRLYSGCDEAADG